MGRLRLVVLLAGLFAVAALAAPGAEEDDCVRAIPKPILKKTAAGIRDHTFRLVEREGRETAVLGDSQRVTIRHSGYAHYWILYQFPWTPPETGSDGMKLLDAADGFMKQVEAVSASPGQEAFIREALQGAARQGSYRPGESIEMTKGYSYVSVDRGENPDGGSIVAVSYEMVL
jgi:hypothetical protein